MQKQSGLRIGNIKNQIERIIAIIETGRLFLISERAFSICFSTVRTDMPSFFAISAFESLWWRLILKISRLLSGIEATIDEMFLFSSRALMSWSGFMAV